MDDVRASTLLSRVLRHAPSSVGLRLDDARWVGVDAVLPALGRFLRPVAYQGLPDAALPAALRAANPWGVPRRVDGVT